MPKPLDNIRCGLVIVAETLGLADDNIVATRFTYNGGGYSRGYKIDDRYAIIHDACGVPYQLCTVEKDGRLMFCGARYEEVALACVDVARRIVADLVSDRLKDAGIE